MTCKESIEFLNHEKYNINDGSNEFGLNDITKIDKSTIMFAL